MIDRTPSVLQAKMGVEDVGPKTRSVAKTLKP